jgi:hypothetical protein
LKGWKRGLGIKEFRTCSWRVGLLAIVALMVTTFNVHAFTITFAPGNYDNTANTVTGTNATPVYNNNQTSGVFRDVFWWGTAYNGGTKGVGSPDFINSGSNLISNGGSPSRAVLGGDDTALNFTGVRTSGGASFLSIYDTIPGDGTATNLFDATGGLEISADVLFTPGNHAASAGVVALYNEGQDGLALLASNGGGNNLDIPKVSLIFQQSGAPTTLTSVSLPGLTTFVGDTNGTIDTGSSSGDHWYRVVMVLSVTGDSFTVNGSFFNHSEPWNPNSALGIEIPGSALSFTGSLSNPDASLRLLTNPGEIGLMAYTPESFSDGVGAGGSGANPLVDNVGVSITNFSGPDTQVPEPATMFLLGSGLIGLAGYGRKKFFRK